MKPKAIHPDKDTLELLMVKRLVHIVKMLLFLPLSRLFVFLHSLPSPFHRLYLIYLKKKKKK